MDNLELEPLDSLPDDLESEGVAGWPHWPDQGLEDEQGSTDEFHDHQTSSGEPCQPTSQQDQVGQGQEPEKARIFDMLLSRDIPPSMRRFGDQLPALHERQGTTWTVYDSPRDPEAADGEKKELSSSPYLYHPKQEEYAFGQHVLLGKQYMLLHTATASKQKRAPTGWTLQKVYISTIEPSTSPTDTTSRSKKKGMLFRETDLPVFWKLRRSQYGTGKKQRGPQQQQQHSAPALPASLPPTVTNFPGLIPQPSQDIFTSLMRAQLMQPVGGSANQGLPALYPPMPFLGHLGQALIPHLPGGHSSAPAAPDPAAVLASLPSWALPAPHVQPQQQLLQYQALLQPLPQQQETRQPRPLQQLQQSQPQQQQQQLQQSQLQQQQQQQQQQELSFLLQWLMRQAPSQFQQPLQPPPPQQALPQAIRLTRLPTIHEHLLQAIFPTTLPIDIPASSLGVFKSQLCHVLESISAQDLLSVRFSGLRDNGKTPQGYACLGHVAVAPSRAAAERGLSISEEAVPELWTIYVLDALRMRLGGTDFGALLCQLDDRRNSPLHWAARFASHRPAVMEWLLGQAPSHLATNTDAAPAVNSPVSPVPLGMLEAISASGWSPLHSLLREAGEQQQLLDGLPPGPDPARAHAAQAKQSCMACCRLWLNALEQQAGKDRAQLYLGHLDSRPYRQYGCAALLVELCRASGYAQPQEALSKGALKHLVFSMLGVAITAGRQ